LTPGDDDVAFRAVAEPLGTCWMPNFCATCSAGVSCDLAADGAADAGAMPAAPNVTVATEAAAIAAQRA
jgi:hypothetical protein